MDDADGVRVEGARETAIDAASVDGAASADGADGVPTGLGGVVGMGGGSSLLAMVPLLIAGVVSVSSGYKLYKHE